MEKQDHHLVTEHNPDVAIISEANIQYAHSLHQINIPRYRIITPKDFEILKFVRLAVLVNTDLNCKEMENMNVDTPSIWLKFPRQGQKPFVVGGYYREHKLRNQPQPNLTGYPKLQRARWKMFLDQCTSLQPGMDVLVAGDLNLDHLKWNNPEQVNHYMVEDTRNRIEILGYSQLVKGATRHWKDTTPSLLDHAWSNNTNRIVHCKNIVIPIADHNLVETLVNLKGKIGSNPESLKRKWKTLDLEKFKQRIE